MKEVAPASRTEGPSLLSTPDHSALPGASLTGSLPEGAGCGDRKAPPRPARPSAAAGSLLLRHATSNTNLAARHSAGVSGLGVAGGVAAGAAGGRAVAVLAALVARPPVGNVRRKPASATSPGTLVRTLRPVLSPHREQGDTFRGEKCGADHAPVCYSNSQQLPMARPMLNGNR